MGDRLRIALAQVNGLVGDVLGNTERIVAEAQRARDELGADLIVFPELTITGYPPEDLLFHGGLRWRVEKGLESVRQASKGIGIVIGYPYYAASRTIFNAASLFHDGATLTTYFKQELPNYGVFDDKRYFTPGKDMPVVNFKGVKLALNICEDLWFEGPCRQAAHADAGLILNLNASPFTTIKKDERDKVLRARVAENGVPIVYVNWVGGQDELVYDGDSTIIDARGNIVHRSPSFEEQIDVIELDVASGEFSGGHVAPKQEELADIYGALILGTRDYVNKHRFPGIVLGLSGGIDSGLTLAIAVDALGADRVQAVMMPSQYTSRMSLEDARKQAQNLGVDYQEISIEKMFAATRDSLAPLFAGLPEDTTEENIQARCRGMILMAISNKTGRMVLTTGNKSEMAVGYATLYGDMAGGFAPIKDCSKTRVFALARYRNARAEVIPERVITRPPTAELKPDQLDSDSLPDYAVLDGVLQLFIEDDASVEDIVEQGYDREVTVRILNMIKRNEYKRRQAPPGIRISKRAFGRDWRYPITSGY